MGSSDSSVKVSSQSADTFDSYDHQKDSNDRSSELRFGTIVPGGTEETRVDGVPIPKHGDYKPHQ
jgi:hypothetical protein